MRSSNRAGSHPSKSQRGFSLIEVMTASLILSGLIIAIGSGWVVADRETSSLITRQKAIFVADMEMERLTTLYGTTSFGFSGPSTTTGYTETAAFPSTRLIYPSDLSSYLSSSQDYTINAATYFTNANSDFQVWIDSNIVSSLSRAYVWVDYDHNIAGRISWTTSTISPSACTVGGDSCPCLNFFGLGLAGSCRKLVFYLEYPYRVVSGSPVADSNLQTITLSTIVGRHT
jgi:prepilin-type N-terminal cleavage/methylation domain-containing protein